MNVAIKEGMQCPNCQKRFEIADIINTDDAVLTCPFCQHQFYMHPSKDDQCDDSGNEDCSWEEHGEPRKTILSSIKPRTDKPMIATFLLLIVVCIGIIASIVPGLFLQTPIMVFSTVGVQGSIAVDCEACNNLIIVNDSQSTLLIEGEQYTGVITNTTVVFENLPLGTREAVITVYDDTVSFEASFECMVIPFFTDSYNVHFINQTSSYPMKVIHDGYGWCTTILLILSVVCLIGMFSSWRRNYSDVAIIGCIVGIFTIGFFFIGSILSIIALYLVYTSRDEFDDGKKGKSF